MITPSSLLSSRSKAVLAQGNLRSREGAMLLLVLVLVACLSVAVYAFSSHSSHSLFLVKSQQKNLSQRLLAESALDRVLAQLDHPTEGNASLDPTRQIVTAGGFESFKGKMVICSTQPIRGRVNIGLTNESSKLNINYLASKNLTREMAVSKLMQYRGMSTQCAEAIVSVVRGPGPDGQVNTSGNMVRSGKRLSSLSELLKIPGVTEELLFGEDSNGDGVLDPNENDGARSYPEDNADGVLRTGWAQHWTVLGGEGTVNTQGEEKIRLNQPDLALLYDQLITRFPPDEVKFVIAWRSAPAIYDSDSTETDVKEIRKADEASRRMTLQDRVRQQLGNEPEPSFTLSIRAGIQLGTSRAIRLPSLQALTDCKVQIVIDGKDQVLVSPFSVDVSKATDWLERWETWTTLSEQPIDESRININQASFETLMTIQGMTESLATSIIRAREAGSGNQEAFATIHWLLDRGLVNKNTLRKIAPECTTGGSVNSGFAIGQLEGSRTCAMIQFTVDSRLGMARLARRVDLPISSAVLP